MQALGESRSTALIDADDMRQMQFSKTTSRSKGLSVMRDVTVVAELSLFFNRKSSVGVMYSDAAPPSAFVKWFLNSPHRYNP